MADTSALEPGTVIAGRYRVAHKIGHGGMGAVYQVSHVHTDERLALKVVHPQVLRDGEAIERFRREARAPARITSEHVARVTDADTAADLDGAPFYVMELLVGRDLERVLAEDGPMPAPVVVEYLRQMARALDKAHAIGIVHRDLKPENLFLTHREDGSPCIKLLDFGIARLADRQGPGPLVTQVGYVFGTPNYMAPEQATGDTELISPATDIWAVGLLAFKLLVGQEFFTGKTSAHLYAQILGEALPTPTARGSTFGPAFDAWFARCVARPIPDRFATAGEAVVALAAALDVQLPERQRSSAEFPVDLRRSQADIARVSQPNVTTGQTSLGIGARPPASRAEAESHAGVVSQSVPMFTGTFAGGGSADARVGAVAVTGLPTSLPAGLPAPTSRRAVFAGVGGLVVLIAGGALVYALRGTTPPASHGLVAARPSAQSSSRAEASSDVDPPPDVPSPTASSPAVLAASTSATSTATHARGTDAKPRSGTTKPNTTNDEPGTLSRAQKKRLEALDRLCAQGTYTASECQSKRQAIIHGGS